MKSRIREIRTSNGMSMQKFGSELGVSSNAVQQWEYGRNKPSQAMIKLMCSKFGVNEDWLVNGMGAMMVDTSLEDEIVKWCMEIKGLPADDPRISIMRMLAKLSRDDWEEIAALAQKLKA